MNIYSRDNPLAWKVVEWYADYNAGDYVDLWQTVLDLLESNPTFNFMDCIELANTYNHCTNNYLQSMFRDAMREAITTANRRKRAGYWGNNIDEIFKSVEV